ncbi:unnamed protein product [Ectocarpus sp. CCAP 1310/34]|nr:unnamed protein product [Ectocarpus sp. CCAP 1310/34]
MFPFSTISPRFSTRIFLSRCLNSSSSETFLADFFAKSPINSIWIFRKASTSTGQAPPCVCL